MEAVAEKTKAEIAEENGEVWWDTDLDEEEQWYEDHFDEFVPAPEWVGEKLREAAKKPPLIHYGDAKKPVSLRLGTTDIECLKTIAKKQGLPYQSLIGSILHRYVNGTLVDILEIRKIFPSK